MGGSGKTTLAKALYNEKSSCIEKSSFVFDVRNAACKNELHDKQRQLLKDLGFKFNDQPFDSIEQGKVILSNYLRSLTVFIILDDVDHRDQLEVLLPGKNSLASGSLIIITTRDKELLKIWGISCIYEMKSMNKSQAQQLFCWHAFLQPSPLSGFEDLLEKFVSVSNGLPLSLKVLGGQLHGCSNKDLWEDALHKISRILPDDILNRLRVSYDALDKEEQQMFLDVACFFIGKNKMIAIAVWEGSGWSGLWGWERLVNKCLVEFVHENEIRMHDHLRELGRDIASTLSPHRLWSPNQVMLINKQEQIRGMILNVTTNDAHKFPNSVFNTSIWPGGLKIIRSPFFYGLKIFVVGENFGNNLHIAKLSRELAWLSCTRIAHRNLPSWMSLKNLRVLELYDCPEIVGLWKDGVEAPVRLRVLIVSSCPKLKEIPKCIGDLKNLKKISLSRGNLKSLPEEFCCLQSLEHLELQNCESLLSLPSCFGHLTNLRHLDLSGSVALKTLPNSCKQFTLLQHLDLQRCDQLTLQSDILENMTRLQYLNLNQCTQLEELPRHISNQASLSELHLEGTRLRELPINIGQLSKLRVMTICPNEGLFQMQSLPDSMGSLTLLERLTLENLGVQSLPKSLKQLTNLQTLKINNCPIGNLEFGRGPFTSLFGNLKEIELASTRVSKITIFDDCCPRLKILRLWDNNHLMEVDTLPTAVEEIWVDYCGLLRNISGIGGMVNLQYLMLIHCPELDTLPSFYKLSSLKVFRLQGDNKVETIQGLQHCTSLEMLTVEGKCWEVSGTKSWEHLQRLRRVQLVVKKISAILPCIQTIQKWPEEITISAKAVAGAGSLINSSAFSNLSDVHSFAKEEFIYNKEFICNLFNHSSDGIAMMLCLLIKCNSFKRLNIDQCQFSGEMEADLTGKDLQKLRSFAAMALRFLKWRFLGDNPEDTSREEEFLNFARLNGVLPPKPEAKDSHAE
ncbi:disease resistance protein RPV1-like [Cryptomeria japonica]|uniref:disease resistance protein RPV1-like n=1 Tax=Cryptomeria japonica TaxID=3369 RepID=UPI0027DA58C3|nr:disease resistance protein RPV1-like [Cryptomeria japonica]